VLRVKPPARSWPAATTGKLHRVGVVGVWIALTAIACLTPSGVGLAAETIPDMSGEYQFLAPEDTLAILEEEGKLKGYIDVYAGEQESDTVLSYQITIGSRKGDHVEFKTSKIHEKYYRFTGAVQRGHGRTESEPDYLRLVGDLEIVTGDSGAGEEHTERRQVSFQSEGKSESDK
jgi:hypothetical protein